MELVDSYGRIGERIVGAKGDRNHTGTSTKSSNLNRWSTQSLNLQPMNIHICAGLRPPFAYAAYVQLGHHVGPQQLEQRQFQKLLPVHVLLAGVSFLASVGEEVPSFPGT